MNFAYPQKGIFLTLAVAVAVLAVLALVRKRRALRRLARQGIHHPGVLARPFRQVFLCGLLLLVAALLGIALLGPEWGWIEEEIPPRRGRDVLVVLDVSRSMLAEDVAPNRLERARADLRELADFLERAGGHRIGLIAFAERAALLCPLTSDYRCFGDELAEASLPSLRLRGHAAWGDGTQIGTALQRVDAIVEEDDAAYTDVLLVSDGEDMAAETLAAADALAQRGITVHALGLGDPRHGSLIPVRDRLGRPAHLHYRGQPVYSQLQEEVLQAIAEHTHGHYFAASTGNWDWQQALGDLLTARASRQRQAVHHERHGIPRFQWFVAPALLLLLFQGLLSDARRANPGPEHTNYFRWVRRSTVAAVGILMVWSFTVSAGPTRGDDPQAAFQRGNELLRQAQQAGLKADPAWLTQAQSQYRACLSAADAAPHAGPLFDAARYNLELAKLLQQQLSQARQPARPSEDEQAKNSPKDHKGKERSNIQKHKADKQQTESRTAEDKARNPSSSPANQPQPNGQPSQGQAGNGSARPKEQQGNSSIKKATARRPGEASGDKSSKQQQQSKPNPGHPELQPDPQASSADERRERGRDRSSEPDASGLFHPEKSPGSKQARTPDGGRGPGQEKSAVKGDPVMQAAVTRLQQALKRIENRRGQRRAGVAPGPEDPANLNRFRDW